MTVHRFRPRLLDALRGYDRRRLAADIGAGVTVGVVALPLAMAFAIASGVKPEQGLVTAIVAGFLISAFGGSNVQIGGPAGAFIVIVYGIVERYGLTNLLISTALAGVLLFLLGLLRLGTLVRYVPVPIIVGFTNGIAVLIALSQLKDGLGLQVPKVPADAFSQLAALGAHLHTFNPWALAVTLASLAVLLGWSRLGRVGDAASTRAAAAWAARLPAPLVVLVLGGAAVALLGLPVDTIGSRFGGIPRALPALELPAFSWASAQALVVPTVTLALLGAVESLLCARVADQASGLPRHDPNQELMAQGIANVAAPLFGGIPATGTIARTLTNARAGATSPIAGMVHALTLLAVVLLAAPLADRVPLPALAAILLHVAWNMGEWRTLSRRHLRRHGADYRWVLLGTFVLTVVFDLTVAVQAGLVAACAFFLWRMATLFTATPWPDRAPDGVGVVRLEGALFFGAVGRIEALADPSAAPGAPAGTRALVLDADRLFWMDASGLDALVQLQRDLQRQGRELWLTGLRGQPADKVQRAGLTEGLGGARLAPDVGSALAALAA
ncbi:SulP family inorganic anion transporter [Aquabacterium sp. J223]|uniref:SulP family inorganic anion transporter n=1 Tax=Aquabacterium sp. J223 TaxID=2898431 RepID=UPI0021AD7E16|nr:SulP family inorganic anion transporter [Aquabacterium sp. J223]UUX95439.1 STAS domain-containing protein [Aquabacterium sp. J223]